MGNQKKTKKITSWNNQKNILYDRELEIINQKLTELHLSTTYPSIKPKTQNYSEEKRPVKEVKIEEEIKPRFIRLNKMPVFQAEVKTPEVKKTEVLLLDQMPVPEEVPIVQNKKAIELESDMLLHQLSDAANELQEVLQNKFGITPEPQKKSFFKKIFS